ncbi:MAG TPA: glycerate kinase [Actinomycetota bacterium]|nr:glycerate kinase [Actinomycetota bacterium]
MHVVIAPDKFKGTLSASEVADALAKGVRAAIPHASLTLRPVGDGGEGTVDALLLAHGGRVTSKRVSGPLGGLVEAPLAHLGDGSCAMEMSDAAGLTLVDPDRRDALASSTLGLGELIAAALDEGERRILIGVGGSASTDGGTGAAAAVGWRFLDADGGELPLGGGSLKHLTRIDPSGVRPEITAATIVAACDVDNPLLGDAGAARVFGPQKGASPKEVEVLEEGLATLATRIREDLGTDVAELPRAGAAGGTGAGLRAFFGAELGPGFDVVAEATHLRDEIDRADLVLTGEGSLDDQSLAGKAPIGVARMALELGVPCYAVAGEVPAEPGALKREGVLASTSLIEAVGSERAFADTAGAIAEATKTLLRHMSDGSGRRRRPWRF